MRTIAAEAILARLPLISPRLRLRRLRQGDTGAVTAFMGDWAVARQSGDLPFPYSDAAARDWIARQVRMLARGRGVSLAVERLQDGAFVGVVSVRLSRAGFIRRHGEVGYWIARPQWGQGFATEAVGAAVPWFEQLFTVRSMEAVTFADNDGSVRVLEKLGFAEAREETRDYPARGGARRVKIFRKRVPRRAPLFDMAFRWTAS